VGLKFNSIVDYTIKFFGHVFALVGFGGYFNSTLTPYWLVLNLQSRKHERQLHIVLDLAKI